MIEEQDTATASETEATSSPERTALLKRIRKEIKLDKDHHAPAFKRMRRDMFVATHGRNPSWPEDSYTANIIGRHIKQKTAALYAKNPKFVARRRETLDFKIWDESAEALEMALQMQQMAATQPPQVDPLTGQPMPPAIPGLAEAQALMADIGEGMQRRNEMKKFGKTLELLADHYLKEQKPLEFKGAMKRLVRRACTTGVAYVELAFQRENGPRPDVSDGLADKRASLDHLAAQMERVSQEDSQYADLEAAKAEIELSVKSLMAEPDIVLREGVVIDYPLSTRVIPDRLCKSLVGFVGARHITIELMFTRDQIKELFGVTISDGKKYIQVEAQDADADEYAPSSENDSSNSGSDLLCVQKYYDKPSGLVYFLCEGYEDFLREPAAPDVFVEDFWPVFAITFNDVESEKELFPLSDVSLLLHIQSEYNRSRQGMREHRDFAKPRMAFGKGQLEDTDVDNLKAAAAFSVIPINLPPNGKVDDILQPIKVPGVDPNLYEVGQLFSDAQFVGGVQEAMLGGTSNSTATESRIAADSTQSADQSSIDDLDSFMSRIARAMGQILMREMSPEKVIEIAGPGAVWPALSMEQIINEVTLEIEAGSTGKPNQALEVRNMREMLPLLIQIPGIKPMWLARQALSRLDDRLDLTEAIAANQPSIIAMNHMSQAAPQNPMADPAAQGDNGAANGPAPPGGPDGSAPAMGDNQDPMATGSTGAAPVF